MHGTTDQASDFRRTLEQRVHPDPPRIIKPGDNVELDRFLRGLK